MARIEKNKEQNDIVGHIKNVVKPEYFNLDTAEGRLAFDDALRSELGHIKVFALRKVAGEMIKAWRAEILFKHECNLRIAIFQGQERLQWRHDRTDAWKNVPKVDIRELSKGDL